MAGPFKKNVYQNAVGGEVIGRDGNRSNEGMRMATSQMSVVIQHLRKSMLLRDALELTDGQLLDSFISRRAEAAFEAIVRRHGPMVMAVCHRVLRNRHDAEDAFQAAFLVLVRKAASVASRELLANWLYGVAYNTALKAKAMTSKRRLREKQVTEMPESESVEKDTCPYRKRQNGSSSCRFCGAETSALLENRLALPEWHFQ